MYYGKPSPFAKWWDANITQMAVSQEIRELLARAFEGGQLAEREKLQVVLWGKFDENNQMTDSFSEDARKSNYLFDADSKSDDWIPLFAVVKD